MNKSIGIYFSKYEDTKAENEAGAKKVEKLSKVDTMLLIIFSYNTM